MHARRLSTFLLLVVVMLSTSSCTKWGAAKKPTWNSATSGEQLTNLFWQDVKAKNWKSVETRLAPIMLAMNATAVSDRSATLAHLKSMDIESFQIGDVRTEPAGNDLIVTYVIAVRGKIGGQPLPSAPIRMMSIWQHLTRDYVLVAHSAVVSAQ